MNRFPVFDATLLPHPQRPRTVVVAEFALPTGSFKDRGAAAVVAAAAKAGARRVTLDSSGNAALAVAAAAARSGLATTVRVSASISPSKLKLLAATGAVIDVHPTRADAVAACAHDREAYDASHVRNPLFRIGIASLARAWAAKGEIPATVYLPVGNGSLLLGLWQGLRALKESGSLSTLPRIVACQAERCAPIARPDAPGDGQTIADGCAILNPPAAEEIRAAIRESGGEAVAIPEAEIRQAWGECWRLGIPIEPTAALPFAALARSPDGGPDAVVATGSGLKLFPESST